MTDPTESGADLDARLRHLQSTPHLKRAHHRNHAVVDTLTAAMVDAVRSGDLQRLVDAAASAAVSVGTGIAHAGVTATLHQHPVTVSTADDTVAALDTAQYRHHDGPCLRALRRGQRQRFTTAQLRGSWPELATLAAHVGISSIHAVPVVDDRDGDGAVVGVLNCYRTADAKDTGAEDDLLDVVVDHLRLGLWAHTRRDLHERVARLHAALDDRMTAGAAVGILMVEHDTDLEHARRLLTDRAAADHVSTDEAARRIVTDHPH